MNTSYEQYGDNYEPESSYERSPSYDDSPSAAYDPPSQYEQSSAQFDPPSAIYGASANNAEAYYSEVEAAILRSADEPISVNEADEITAAGQRGIYANKAEVAKWRGPLPIVNKYIFLLSVVSAVGLLDFILFCFFYRMITQLTKI